MRTSAGALHPCESLMYSLTGHPHVHSQWLALPVYPKSKNEMMPMRLQWVALPALPVQRGRHLARC